MKFLSMASVCIVSCVIFGTVSADEASAVDEDARTARPIVVTATRSTQDAADIAANVTIVDRETIESSAAVRVDHLLRKIPGFSLLRQQSSIVSGQTIQGVSLRGVGQSATSRTLVLLDGIPLNDPFGNFIIWSRVPFESIERIEVVRGGGSGIWGNLALGGVIQIITERPTERTVRFLAEGGTRGNSNFDLFAADRNGRVSYSFGSNLYSTDGYFKYSEEDLGRVDERVSLSNETYNGSIDFELAPGSRIYGRASFSDEDKTNGTPLSLSSMINRYYNIGADIGTSDGSEWNFNLFSTSRSGNSVSTSIARSRESETPRSERYDLGAVSVGANLQWAKEFTTIHRLAIGADFLWSDSRSNEFTGWDREFEIFTKDSRLGGKQIMGGVFAQEIWTPTIRWNVVLGARLDQIKNKSGFSNVRVLGTSELISETNSPDVSNTAFSPSLGVVYHASNSVSLRGSTYKAFRAPTISELYRTTGSSTVNAGNADLGPEDLVGGEFGFNYSPTSFFDAKVTGFWSEVDGTITLKTMGVARDSAAVIEPCGLLPEDGTCRQQNNVGRLRTRGVEVEISLVPHAFWSFTGSYIYDDAELIESADSNLVGNRIRHVPRHHFVLNGSFNKPSLFAAHVQARFVGDRFENDVNDLPINDLFVVDLQVSRRISPWAESFLSVENLLDKAFEVRPTSTGLTELGMPRMIHGGLRVRM